MLYSGNQFILLPLALAANEGRITQRNAGRLAVLPVIASFANEERVAWPSQETIAILAGVRKADVSAAVDALEAEGWFSKTVTQRGRRRFFSYRMLYGQPGPDDQANFISFHHTLIRNGVWSLLTPAAKVLYTVLRAACLPEHRATINWENEEAAGDTMSLGGHGGFLPAHYYDVALVKSRTQLPDRTYHNARNSLRGLGLLRPSNDEEREGWVLPGRCEKYAPSVLSRLESSQNPRVPRAAKAALTKARANSTAIWEPPSATREPMTAIWKPNDCHQGTAKCHQGTAKCHQGTGIISSHIPYSGNHEEVIDAHRGVGITHTPKSLPQGDYDFLVQKQRELDARREAENQGQKSHEESFL